MFKAGFLILGLIGIGAYLAVCFVGPFLIAKTKERCEVAQLNWDFSNRTNAVVTINGVDHRGVGWREPQTGFIRCIVVKQVGEIK